MQHFSCSIFLMASAPLRWSVCLRSEGLTSLLCRPGGVYQRQWGGGEARAVFQNSAPFFLMISRTALEGIFPRAPTAVGYPPTAVSIRGFFTAVKRNSFLFSFLFFSFFFLLLRTALGEVLIAPGLTLGALGFMGGLRMSRPSRMLGVLRFGLRCSRLRVLGHSAVLK